MAQLRFRLSLLALVLFVAGPAAAEIELISRVSYPAGATQPGTTAASGRRSLAADGRFAVFSTTATAVAPGVVDANGDFDVYLQDRVTGNWELISHAPGIQFRAAAGASLNPMISADGRYVIFHSPDSLNTNLSIYRYDRVSRQRQLVSHQRGQPAQSLPGFNYHLDVSGDGRFVVFASMADASLLVENAIDQNQGDVSTRWDLFLWDALTDTFQLISHLPDAALTTPTTPSTTDARHVEVADDGKVAFRGSRILAPGGGSGATMFLFDPQTGINRLVSRSSSSPTVPAAAAVSAFCDLSPNGRYVLFTHPGTDLIAGLADTNAADDLFLFDGDSGNLELISSVHLDPATTGNAVSACGKISTDGRYVSFTSTAANLAPGNHATTSPDLFRRDRQTSLTQLLSGSAADPLEATGQIQPLRDTFAADGLTVFFDSSSTALVAGASPGGGSPWAYRWEDGTLLLGAPAAGGPSTTFTTETQASAADGSRSLLVTSMPTALTGALNVAVDAPSQPVFYETGGVATTLAMPAAFAGSGSPTRPPYPYPLLNAEHSAALVSEDGRKVAFVSDSNEICGSGRPLCLLDRATKTFTNVKHLPQNPGSFFTEETFPLEISQDGRWLLLKTMSPALTTVDTNNFWDVYLYDTTNRTFELLSHAAGAPTTTANQGSRQLREGRRGLMTPAADRVVFESRATNLVAGATVSGAHIYFRDRQAGGLRLLSHRFDNPSLGADASAFAPTIAAGGGYVAFFSNARNLIDGYVLSPDYVGLYDLYLYDLATSTAKLVSFTSNNPLEGHTGTPLIIELSTDGRFLLHGNFTAQLIAGGTDTNGNNDLFQFDRTTGVNTLITHAHGQPLVASDGTSNASLGMSSDGRFVVFRSNATNILPGVSGNQVYLWDRLDSSHRLISHRRGNANQPLTGSLGPANLTPDGKRVLFSSDDPNVIPGRIDTNADYDLFTWDRVSDQIELVTPKWGSSSEAAGGNCQMDLGNRPPAGQGEFQLLWCRGALTPFDNNGGYATALGIDLYLLNLPPALFADGFESASTAAWSLTVP